ncbi:MAG: hypothetical protein ISQ06_08105 [Planctomycetaceae bacterium]|nr:hypothetical protein [Planctomycetaceae bacterium]
MRLNSRVAMRAAFVAVEEGVRGILWGSVLRSNQLVKQKGRHAVGVAA